MPADLEKLRAALRRSIGIHAVADAALAAIAPLIEEIAATARREALEEAAKVGDERSAKLARMRDEEQRLAVGARFHSLAGGTVEAATVADHIRALARAARGGK